MNDTTGTIYQKVVNTIAKKQTIKINLNGAKVLHEATLVVVKGSKPDDTNTITDPERLFRLHQLHKALSQLSQERLIHIR